MQKLFTQMFSNKKIIWLTVFTLLFVVGSMIAGVFVGAVSITVPDIFKIIAGKILGMSFYDGEKTTELIIWEIRFSRVVLAFLVGASLSLAGAAFQGLLRNTLADPYTIGVSSGATLGAVLVLFFQIPATFIAGYTQPIIAILFGLGTLIIVLIITNFASGKLSNETIILAGIILSSFMGAIVSLLIALTPREDISNILYWTMGSVAMRGWGHVQLILPFFIIGAAIILIHYRELNNMALGEQSAQFSGMDVKSKKKLILIGASILTGAAVAVSGAIGFVGLVIPHLVRLLTGANHRYVLPFSLLIGGAYLVLADLLARTIIAPTELPIGVVTALIGTPIFTILLVKQRFKKRNA
ncbi:FecCD family ABC transporter permease [Bacillus massiliigorillae]|uniref:FecCD family ABC transporter permease n=1 Tax=Bacillus massiliigorillae TaxID=1243664 RepID=UPI001E405C7F|nr:iron ABC transporter permease [Bacillus massiliigorillae]